MSPREVLARVPARAGRRFHERDETSAPDGHGHGWVQLGWAGVALDWLETELATRC